jgi:nucleotide-binding universal stress UspA family protein
MASRILVPLDGSSLAEQAISCAVTLARGLPAELVLLRAIWIPPDVLGILDEATVELNVIEDQLETEANEYLSRLVEQLNDADLSTHHAIRRGAAADVIVDYARRTDVSQIIMATHGYTGIKRWTHGSVAERVVQSASVPVLLVRARENASRDTQAPMLCQRILVPLDGSEMAEHVLSMVTPIAQALDAELILFQVPIAHVDGWMTGEWFVPMQGVLATAERDAHVYLSEVCSRLKKQGLRVTTATTMGSVAESIIEYAEANHVDLVAMCTHGRTGLARWTLGSVADRVLRAGSTPILLVRAK